MSPGQKTLNVKS